MSRHSSGHFTPVHHAVAVGLLYSISAAALPSVAQAASFGKTHITSAQNEPLTATLPVTDIKVSDFSVTLATADLYQQMGLLPTDSMSVRFVPNSSTSGDILIETSQPLMMPFTDVVLALNDAGQQTVMPKTLLLPLSNDILASILENKTDNLSAENTHTVSDYDHLNTSTAPLYTNASVKKEHTVDATNNTTLNNKNNTKNSAAITNAATKNELAKSKLTLTPNANKAPANYDTLSARANTGKQNNSTDATYAQALIVKQGMPPPLLSAIPVSINPVTALKSEAPLLAAVNKKPSPAHDTVRHTQKQLITSQSPSSLQAKDYSLDTLTVQVTRRVLMVNQRTTLDAASHAMRLADIAKNTTMSLFAAQAIGLNQLKTFTGNDVSAHKLPKPTSHSEEKMTAVTFNTETPSAQEPHSTSTIESLNVEITAAQSYQPSVFFGKPVFFSTINTSRLPYMMQLDFPIITPDSYKNDDVI